MSDDLLPINSTAQERAMALATARVSDVPVRVRESWDPDTCPANLLPWLAWAFSVDKWDATWTEQQKRDAIKASVYIHRHKGTPAAMQAALDAMGYEMTAQEWHQMEPNGDPYTFGINVEILDVGVPDQDAFDRIVDVANSAKNVRSHMTFINMHSTRTARVYAGGIAFSGETVSVDAEVATLFADGTAVADGTYKANGVRA
jgi:phage tail P2-like protein